MNKLNRVLIASPLEFAAIFGEITSDAATEARAATTGTPQGAAAVAGVGPEAQRTPSYSGIARGSKFWP